MRSMRSLLVLSTVSVLSMLVLASCSNGGPEEHSFSIEVENGAPVGEAQTFTVRAGDTVTFTLRSDSPVTFHLHGYDVEREVGPGETGEMAFEANATGRFPIELEDTEVEVGILEVQPR